MKQTLSLLTLCFTCSVLYPHIAHAAEPDVQEIIDRVAERNALGFDNAASLMTLTITSKSGAVQKRDVEIFSRSRAGTRKIRVRFVAPNEVAGTAFLAVQANDGSSEQYLYLPAVGKIKRISSSQRNQRFMGTDLTYADLDTKNLREMDTRKLADGEIGGNPTYVLESVARQNSHSEYSKTKSWIHKASHVPLRIEFYDHKERLQKVITVKRLEKKGDVWVVMESLIESKQRGSTTRLAVNTVDVNAQLGDALFTKRALAP